MAVNCNGPADGRNCFGGLGYLLPRSPKATGSKKISDGHRPPLQLLSVGLRLGQVHHAAALFPHATLFEQVDAFETLEDVALGCDGAGRTEAAMLGHMIYLKKLNGRVIQAEPARTTSKDLGNDFQPGYAAS